jgi:hypothetical protein
MCSAAINLTSRALGDVTNAEVLLKIKGVIALFIQTMEVSTDLWIVAFFEAAAMYIIDIANEMKGYGYSVSSLDTFLLALFDKYAELLKRRFSEDFQEASTCGKEMCSKRKTCR